MFPRLFVFYQKRARNCESKTLKKNDVFLQLLKEKGPKIRTWVKWRVLHPSFVQVYSTNFLHRVLTRTRRENARRKTGNKNTRGKKTKRTSEWRKEATVKTNKRRDVSRDPDRAAADEQKSAFRRRQTFFLVERIQTDRHPIPPSRVTHLFTPLF